MIPISKPSIDTEELNAIKPIFNSGWLGMGQATQNFEEKIKSYIGAKHVIATNTGTNAIHLAMDT